MCSLHFHKYCHFWDKPGDGCKYCPLTPTFKSSGCTEEQADRKYIKEAFEEALKQRGRFSHVMLTGGSILSGEELLDDELESYIAILKILGEFFETDRFPSQLIATAFNERQLERLHKETKVMTYTPDIEVLNEFTFNKFAPSVS